MIGLGGCTDEPEATQESDVANDARLDDSTNDALVPSGDAAPDSSEETDTTGAEVTDVTADGEATSDAFVGGTETDAGQEAGPNSGTTEADSAANPESDGGAPSDTRRCLSVDQQTIDFGVVPVGSRGVKTLVLSACGADPVTVIAIDILPEGTASPFSAPALPSALIVSPHFPVVLEVAYAPRATSLGAGGAPTDEQASLVITSDSNVPKIGVTLRGATTGRAEDARPDPVIAGLPEGAVALGATVYLDGSQSIASAPITTYGWSVVAPAGSTAQFEPAATGSAADFVLDVSGSYTFTLTVTDALGRGASASRTVVTGVADDIAGLSIELRWNTPGDPNPLDTYGTDLDLHFAHPNAVTTDVDGDGTPDPWYAGELDCSAFNTHPNWNSPDASDDPDLLREDADGAGPEQINLWQPNVGACYRVGVHYWDDQGFGASTATVRVFSRGSLVFVATSPPLLMRDMWDVTKLCWPLVQAVPPAGICALSGDTCSTARDCGLGGTCVFAVTHDYQNPDYPTP